MKTYLTNTCTYGFALLLLAASSQLQTMLADPVDASQLPAASLQSPPVAVTQSPIAWKTPAGWTEVPPTEIRVASFKVNQNGQQADISVIPLGGMAGGDGANVNRWRGQVGLPALSPDGLQKLAEPLTIDGQPAALFDVAGTNPGSGDVSRILAAIQHRDDTTWFFKMTGDGSLVEQQKAAFKDFLKSITFSGVAAATADLPPNLPPGHPALPANLPAGHPDIAGIGTAAADTSAPISHEGQPAWQVPSGWQEISGGQFLIAKFLIPGAGDSRAAVNVSRSEGDGGGLAANVSRWRGQLGLSPVDNISSIPLQTAGGNGVLVDLTGTSAQTGQPARLIGVQVTQPGQVWFYKMMGDPAVVASQKDAFVNFVRGVNY